MMYTNSCNKELNKKAILSPVTNYNIREVHDRWHGHPNKEQYNCWDKAQHKRTLRSTKKIALILHNSVSLKHKYIQYVMRNEEKAVAKIMFSYSVNFKWAV